MQMLIFILYELGVIIVFSTILCLVLKVKKRHWFEAFTMYSVLLTLPLLGKAYPERMPDVLIITGLLFFWMIFYKFDKWVDIKRIT